ncbi:MAG: hypothetical protein ACRD98_05495, partial [Nitrososphaera sp.]
MSDILYNSYRFSAANSARVDVAGSNRGQLTADGRYGFDCSGFLTFVLNKSGYGVSDGFSTGAIMASKGQLSSAGQQWQKSIDTADVKSGDLVWFSGHAGIVVSFDASTGKGIFRSSTGANSDGKGVADAEFSVGAEGKTYWGGGSKPFFGFTRVTKAYDQDQDIWKGSDTNKFPALEPAPILSASGLASTAYQNSWLTQMQMWEAGGDERYNLVNKSGTAFGAYQMQRNALQAIDWMDAQGNWKEGRSLDQFLKTPALQDQAARLYAEVLEDQLTGKGTWNYIGKVIGGRLITEEGLMAIAWRWGASGAANELEAAYNSGGKLRAETAARLDNFRGTNPPSGDGADGILPGITVPVPFVSHSPDMPIDVRSSSSVTHHQDQSTTYDWEAKTDSDDGSIKKGDLVSVTYDAQGRPEIKTIWHLTGEVEQTSMNADRTQETSVAWNKDGSKQTQITTNVPTDGGAGQIIGDFIYNGKHYAADGSPLPESGQASFPPIDPSNVVTPSTTTPAMSQA